MLWFVKGYIEKWNGHPINWGVATVATIKEKARCSGVMKPKVERLYYIMKFHYNH
jgi:hypothetical protein